MEKVQGYEVTEYTKGAERPGEQMGMIEEIVRDQADILPSVNVQVAFISGKMRLTYISSEVALHQRMREAEERAKKALDETVKNLKKEYRSRAKKTLKISEVKGMSDYAVQKASLNERYTYAVWRYYELG